MGWALVLAWSVAALCSLLALRLRRRLLNLKAPEPTALLSELLAEVGASAADSESIQRAAIADLNRRLADVSFELGLLPARFTALTRICLASGTALALFGYISSDARSPVERVLELVACGAGGVFGAACVLLIGRMAKQQGTAIREAWDRSSRETGKTLGTSLEAPRRAASSTAHAERSERGAR